MAYTRVNVIAPDSAEAGEVVPVTVEVKNTWDYQFAVYVEVTYNSDLAFESSDRWVYPGERVEFDGSFIMPNRSITIHAYSYVEDEEGYWNRDSEGKKSVTLQGEVKKLPLLPVALLSGGVVALVALAKRGK